MLRRLRSLRVALWLGMLALAFAALAPSVSRLLQAGRGDASPWMAAVCTTPAHAVQSAHHAAPAAPQSAAEDCPYCALRVDGAGTPAALAVPVDAFTGAAEVPPLVLHEPRPSLSWRPAQSRAPPFAS